MDRDSFKLLKPADVLVEHDELITFATYDTSGTLCLAHILDGDNAGRNRYLVVPVTTTVIAHLEAGALTLLDALDQPIAWLVDVDQDGNAIDCWRTTIAEIPADALPHRDVLLSRHLEPLSRVKATGKKIKAGSVPVAALRNVIDGMDLAYRDIRNAVGLRNGLAQRRTANVLDAQQIRFGSIEVAFTPAVDVEADDETAENERIEQDEIERLLAIAIQWAHGDHTEYAKIDRDSKQVVLAALVKLSPKQGENTGKIEIGGRIVRRAGLGRRATVSLTQGTRSSARRQLAEMSREPNAIYAEGDVQVQDKGKLQITIRNRRDRQLDLTVGYDLDKKPDVERVMQGDVPWIVYAKRPNERSPYDLVRFIEANAENREEYGLTSADDEAANDEGDGA